MIVCCFLATFFIHLNVKRSDWVNLTGSISAVIQTELCNNITSVVLVMFKSCTTGINHGHKL